MSSTETDAVFTGFTERGFGDYRFPDAYGNGVLLRESSVGNHIWVFPEITRGVGGATVCGAHLTPEMARDLGNRLVAWAKASEPDAGAEE